MPHNEANNLSATLMGCLLFGTTANDQIFETMPISACFTGAMLAGIRMASNQDRKDGVDRVPKYRWAMPIISGVATGIFAGPFIMDMIGLGSFHFRIFGYFLMGMIGSTLVDTVLDKREAIAAWIIRKGIKGKVSSDNPIDKA